MDEKIKILAKELNEDYRLGIGAFLMDLTIWLKLNTKKDLRKWVIYLASNGYPVKAEIIFNDLLEYKYTKYRHVDIFEVFNKETNVSNEDSIKTIEFVLRFLYYINGDSFDPFKHRKNRVKTIY